MADLPSAGDSVSYHPGFGYGRSDAPRPAVVVREGATPGALDLAVTPSALAEPPELVADVRPVDESEPDRAGWSVAQPG